VRRLQRLPVPPDLQFVRQKLIARSERQCGQVTTRVLLRWPRLERRLTRLLAEKKSAPVRRLMEK
jgi:hypothetical protein